MCKKDGVAAFRGMHKCMEYSKSAGQNKMSCAVAFLLPYAGMIRFKFNGSGTAISAYWGIHLLKVCALSK